MTAPQALARRATVRETHPPVIVDPSHAGGCAHLVTPLALAAVAAGADGLIAEVHPDLACAKSDGEQSLTFDVFAAMMNQVQAVARVVGRDCAVGAWRSEVPA
jgi:3-deoxy-7-phosphoheptulonate synthase